MADNSSGRVGESYAEEYLKKEGCTILSRNFRTKYGEIDIIARDGEYIIFIEVKTRSKNHLYAPSLAVDPRKQKRIISSAHIYIAQKGLDFQPRFDIIEVIIKSKRDHSVVSFSHIKSAFDLSGE